MEARILVVDTATEVCGVALAAGSEVLVELMMVRGLTHARLLIDAVRSVLEQGSVRLDELDAIAVTTGPGSFTGLRIGISTVKGLALSAGKPLIGLSTLAVMAHQAPGGTELVCPMLDARRREVYWALYRRLDDGLRVDAPDTVGPAAGIGSRIDASCTFIGSGSTRYRQELLPLLKHPGLWAAEDQNRPRPAVAARLAAQLFKNGSVRKAGEVNPLYLRRSDAEYHRKQLDSNHLDR